MNNYIAKLGDNLFNLYKTLKPGQLIIVTDKLRVKPDGSIAIK